MHSFFTRKVPIEVSGENVSLEFHACFESEAEEQQRIRVS